MHLLHKKAYTNIKGYRQIFHSQDYDYRLSRRKDNPLLLNSFVHSRTNSLTCPNRRIQDFTDLGRQTVSGTALMILKWQANEKMRRVLWHASKALKDLVPLKYQNDGLQLVKLET